MKVAEPTVERLVRYNRLLTQLAREGGAVISSQEIGNILGLKASQVRKDLSYFGEIGKRGVGYNVEKLNQHIGNILSPPHKWHMGLVGVGHLGRALLGYSEFHSDKYEIEALFDVNMTKVGQMVMERECYHIDELSRVVEEKNLEVLILTVPPDAAQGCVDLIAGQDTVKGILNFSPTTVVAPENILVYSVDISVELEKLLFFMKHREEKLSRK